MANITQQSIDKDLREYVKTPTGVEEIKSQLAQIAKDGNNHIISVQATEMTAGTGTPSLSKYQNGIARVNHWSMSGSTTGQSVTTYVRGVGQQFDGMEISAFVISPTGTPTDTDYDVFQQRINPIVFGTDVDSKNILGDPVIHKVAGVGVIDKIVLESFARIDTANPLSLLVYRKNDDVADTWVNPSGIVAIEAKPVSIADPITITEPNGYQSWAFITDIKNKLVCVYSIGASHNIPDSTRSIWKKTSLDGGKTWSTPTKIIDTIGAEDIVKGKGKDSNGDLLLWVQSAGQHHFYKSTDGDTYSKISSPSFSVNPVQISDILNVPTVGLMAFYHAGNYSVGDSTKSWGIVKSADNGLTWTQEQKEGNLPFSNWPTEISGAYVGDGKIIAMGRNELGVDTTTTTRAMFQLQSSDYGSTWSKTLTNITDSLTSTPSIIYDEVDGTLDVYYYQRGQGVLRKRSTTLASVWSKPLLWSRSYPIAIGSTSLQDAGNVNATRINDTDIIVYYSGDATNTGIYAVID
jgi:BNR repeat-like domain